MTRNNLFVLLAVTALAMVFAYRRFDFSEGVAGFWLPLLITVAGFNLPALLVCGIDALMNRRFNDKLFNSISYFVIGFLLLVFFFPGFLNAGN